MLKDHYTEEYIGILEKNEALYAKDAAVLKNRIAASTAIIHGEPVPCTYQGLFYDEKDEAVFREVTAQIMQIGRKVTKAFVEDASYRALFRYDPRLEALICHDPGYDVPVPIARYDLFYNGTADYKFCEFNTDGASAMNEDYVLSRLLLETEGMKAFSKKYSLRNIDQIETWVDTLLEMCAKYTGKTRPNVAICDILELGTTNEFIEFQKRFEQRGLSCVICDIRSLSYREGRLYAEDMPIDVMYRRFVSGEMMKVYDQVSDFINAYRENAFLMIGSFRSQIMHSKTIFEILRHEKTAALLTQEERDFIDRVIPVTKTLTRDDIPMLLKNKEAYILKPKEGYASHGVFTGRDLSPEEYRRALERAVTEDYIYQEYFDMKKCPFVEFINGKMTVSEFGQVVGLFIYNERFISPYTRIGKESLISGARRYYTAPALRIGTDKGERYENREA